MYTIRIGNGQGFWGDNVDAPVELLCGGPIDYIGMDYLAEVTLSIMMRQKLKDERLCYAVDFIGFVRRVLPELAECNVRVLTNAGGLNPRAFCSDNCLAAGTVYGHILECGPQYTGGNFSRWWEVPVHRRNELVGFGSCLLAPQEPPEAVRLGVHDPDVKQLQHPGQDAGPLRLIFDQNLSPRLVSLLCDLYPDSLHVRDVGLREADDAEVWHFARKEGLTIVSKDADFHQRSFVYGHPPKVVWVRVGNCSTALIVSLLRMHYETLKNFCSDPEAAFLALA